ncbi:MAG: HAD family hydrolase [Proteobacteria bacterium]|nr:HAD family hydrolase [Pseudomonadota bacterium]
MRDIKVVAFDCDGVMFDTVKANTAYYNQILKHFGRPAMTAEQIAYSHMHTADQSIAKLFEDEKSIQAAQAFRKKMSYLPFIDDMVIAPDLKPLIQRLRPRYKTAVATNRSDTMDRVITEHNLEGYFDLVVSACDVKRPKPYPDPLLKILEFFKIDAGNLIYIGDSQLDEEAARAAGVIFIAYQNTALSAALHITRLNEIENILWA